MCAHDIRAQSGLSVAPLAAGTVNATARPVRFPVRSTGSGRPTATLSVVEMATQRAVRISRREAMEFVMVLQCAIPGTCCYLMIQFF